MSKHSQIPWTAREDGEIYAGDGDFIATAKYKEDEPLIAAAPEMLAALEEAHSFIRRLRDCYEGEAIDLLTNSPGEDMEEKLAISIAKAKGQTP